MDEQLLCKRAIVERKPINAMCISSTEPDNIFRFIGKIQTSEVDCDIQVTRLQPPARAKIVIDQQPGDANFEAR